MTVCKHELKNAEVYEGCTSFHISRVSEYHEEDTQPIIPADDIVFVKNKIAEHNAAFFKH